MAKEKEYNIHFVGKEVEKTREGIDSLAVAVNKLTDTIDSGNKKQGDGYEKAETKSQSYFGKFVGWAMAAWGAQKAIAEVTKAIQLQTQAMEENARVAESQQASLLRLQFLGEFYKEKPELREEVTALAEYGRRPFEEVAGAYYNLRSKAGALPKEQQSSIMREALEMGRTDQKMPLDTLVDMFSLYAKLTGEKDANRVQNVLQKTVEQAGGTGADVASYMPQFLPVGLAGGLSGSQAAGLWSYVTTQTASPSIATTGLRATFMGLQGKGTPESAKMLKKFGISESMDFATKIDTLSGAYKSGSLTLGDAEQIAGREGASILLSLLQNPEAMRQTMSNVVSADRGDIDITGSMINELMGSDPIARSEENIRLLNIALANQRASDPDALKGRELRLRQEYVARQRGMSEYGIATADWMTKVMLGFGVDPDALEAKRGYGPRLETSLRERDMLPQDYSSAGPVIINNQNVNYNRAMADPKPRIDPNDVR